LCHFFPLCLLLIPHLTEEAEELRGLFKQVREILINFHRSGLPLTSLLSFTFEFLGYWFSPNVLLQFCTQLDWSVCAREAHLAKVLLKRFDMFICPS
jgi:uncharacterized BrkB/YihY/UPF0761 family membrane protein